MIRRNGDMCSSDSGNRMTGEQHTTSELSLYYLMLNRCDSRAHCGHRRVDVHWLQLVSRGMTAKTAHFHEFSKFVKEPTTVAARVAFSFPASSIFRSGNVTKNATKILPSTGKLMSLTAQQGRESRSSAFSTSPSDSGLQAHPPQSINLRVSEHLSPWPDRVLRAAARYHSG
jgi:hypothetical protein